MRPETVAASAGTMTRPEPGHVGDPVVNDFYLVLGWVGGGVSGPSNRIGEFDFARVPGS